MTTKGVVIPVVAGAVLALTGAFVSMSAEAAPNNCDDPLVRCSTKVEPQKTSPQLGVGTGYYTGLGENAFGLGPGYGGW
ncbi:MAG: hypothetical protein K0U84_23670 [Actinomycetia bacterium]|nr:hypothetical protein [Actinomycetes bacterium]